jgi:hypothetical protein
MLRRGTRKEQYEVVKDIMTHNGTLHKGDIVTITEKLEKEYKVKDGVGKIWYINKNDVKPL